jgi:riboflavin kinase/FMN adenylyltransferase
MIAAATQGTVVAIGNFDGVHRGHRALLARAKKEAQLRGLPLVVLTFDPHPAAALGRTPPPRLMTLTRRTELLKEAGVDCVETLVFTAEFAGLSPEAFIEQILVTRLRASVLFVGSNFRFGHKRAGDLETLRRDGRFALGDAALLEDAEGAVSSSRVREAIAAGELATVAELLGRPHALEGGVVHGDAKGRTIGFPTANLGDFQEMLPAHGVYATHVERLSEGGAATLLGLGVTNIGVRPTVAAVPELRVETHILPPTAANLDLYGAKIRVSFVARIRGEERFSSFDALRAAIARDVIVAQEIHGLQGRSVPPVEATL